MRTRAATLLGLSLLALTALVPARGEDTVVLKSGDARGGEITAETEDGISFRYEVRLSNGRIGTKTVALPRDQIDHILFDPLPGEEEALASPDPVPENQLRDLWLGRLKHLAVPRSNAPDLGLRYAGRLLAQDSPHARERALEIYRRIERDAWKETARAAATRGRLQALIRLGRVDEAMVEARRMAREAEEPAVLLEAKYVLASAAFDQLQAIEEEHPRWNRDDEVRPERNTRFHEALDLFLFAYLFHGSEEDAAARGLLGAARVHAFAGDADLARRCAEDILRLYPATPYREPAQKLIDRLSSTESP